MIGTQAGAERVSGRARPPPSRSNAPLCAPSPGGEDPDPTLPGGLSAASCPANERLRKRPSRTERQRHRTCFRACQEQKQNIAGRREGLPALSGLCENRRKVPTRSAGTWFGTASRAAAPAPGERVRSQDRDGRCRCVKPDLPPKSARLRWFAWL